MKHIEIIMPQIKTCSAQACGFNQNTACHARAVTIGNEKIPGCDTYFNVSDEKGHAKSVGRLSGVGACKVADCKFNEDYECMADEITVGMHRNKANCMTYIHQ